MPPLGTGSFADVREGTYRFPGQADPTLVAFKVFRGGMVITPTVKDQILKELRAGAPLRHPLCPTHQQIKLPPVSATVVMTADAVPPTPYHAAHNLVPVLPPLL